MLKEAIFADVVSTGKEKDGIMQWGDHQFKANTADIGLNLMVNFLAELLVLFIVVSGCRVADPLNEIGGVVLNVILQVDLPACLFLLALLIPPLTLLLFVLHQLLII